MKKLLFVMGGLDGGGAEKILVDTLNAICDRYDVTLLLIFNKGILIPQLNQKVKIRTLMEPDSNMVKWFYRCMLYGDLRWFYSFMVPEDYDVEIAFLEGLATHFVGSSNKTSRKIAWVHIDMIENAWADVDYRNAEQHERIYGNFDDIVCVSDYCRNQFVNRFGFHEKTTVLYNVLDDSAVRSKAAVRIAEAGIEKQAFCFVSSGRLTPQKGFDRLLAVTKRLHESGFNLNLCILGEGGMRKVLEDYIQDNNMSSYVSLIGYQSNPYPYMKAADAFVCSSRSEGFSTVVTEAFILGLPVVSVDCSGARELLEDGKYGILTENSEDALYEGMKLLLEDSAQYAKYKELSCKRGRDFTKESRLAELEQFIDR